MFQSNGVVLFKYLENLILENDMNDVIGVKLLFLLRDFPPTFFFEKCGKLPHCLKKKNVEAIV